MLNKLFFRPSTLTHTRSLSMLVGNRTGLLSNNIPHSMSKLQSTQNLALSKNLDSSSSSVFSIFQLVTRRFMKVNFRITRLKKKRKFGFLARIKTHTGRKILAAKKKKGRRFLTY
jgi:large subunit ribosomal protein L34